jgi:hypothetical protein
MFDNTFMPLARPEINFKHETASVAMLDHLLAENPSVRADLEQIGGLSEADPHRDWTFIKELIAGPSTSYSGRITRDNWPYEGRGPELSFLYQIVSNYFNGIDVDKFDYLARDSRHLNVPITFSYERYIDVARVLYSPEDELWHICVRDKDVRSMYDLFQSRVHLHQCTFQHKTGAPTLF